MSGRHSRLSTAHILSLIPKNGCIIVFNAYLPSWRTAIALAKVIGRRCTPFAFKEGKFSTYDDLYITRRGDT